MRIPFSIQFQTDEWTTSARVQVQLRAGRTRPEQSRAEPPSPPWESSTNSQPERERERGEEREGVLHSSRTYREARKLLHSTHAEAEVSISSISLHLFSSASSDLLRHLPFPFPLPELIAIFAHSSYLVTTTAFLSLPCPVRRKARAFFPLFLAAYACSLPNSAILSCDLRMPLLSFSL